jgi:hypothetical protein
MAKSVKLKLPDSQMRRFTALVETGAINEAIIQPFLDRNDVWEDRMLSIDRSLPFDPAKLYHKPRHFEIWRGAVTDRGFSGIKRLDKRAYALKKVDFCRVYFEYIPQRGNFEEGMAFFKNKGCILADAGIGWMLLQEDQNRTLEHLYKKFKVRHIYLLGTIWNLEDCSYKGLWEPRVLELARNENNMFNTERKWVSFDTNPLSMRSYDPVLVVSN